MVAESTLAAMFQFTFTSIVHSITIVAISGVGRAFDNSSDAENSIIPSNSTPNDPVRMIDDGITYTLEHESSFDNYLKNVYEDHRALYNYANEAAKVQDQGSLQMKQWAESAAFLVDSLYNRGEPRKASNLEKFHDYVTDGLLNEDPIYDEFARLFRFWKDNMTAIPSGQYLVHHMKPFYNLRYSLKKKLSRP